ncbi:hypothetical protein, partial [Bradyrhizobium sp. NAS80.1]|uniref:hypothetical protein n=1 Tax=Bradyrhizobium sp. NAS80.1 TaxID=1680159 RepID=UPI001AEF3E4D
AFWAASPSRFFRRATSAFVSKEPCRTPALRITEPGLILPPATVGLSALVSTVRVAIGTALPGFCLFPGMERPGGAAVIHPGAFATGGGVMADLDPPLFSRSADRVVGQ